MYSPESYSKKNKKITKTKPPQLTKNIQNNVSKNAALMM
jgi:hypothetical protein